MGYLLTLVHGTWPDPHGWVSARSFLRRELASRLGDVVFQEFSWAGANTHAARADGGAALAGFLRAGRARHPKARHFVIAHSHGGNVALYAMHDPAARDAVDGIVTLATPFLSARPRHLRHARVLAWLVLGIAALATFPVVVVLDTGYLFPIWVLSATFAIDRTLPALTMWLATGATAVQVELVSAYQAPAVDPGRLFIVSPSGDEAGTWLRAWEVLATATLVIGCVLLVLADFAFRSNVVPLVNGFAKSIAGRGLDEVRLFGLDGWSLAVAGVGLCAVWAAGLLVVSSMVRWPGYWREPLLANILVRIRSHVVPATAGGWSLTSHTFEVPREPLFSRLVNGRLRHSAICEQEAVVSAISNWIRDGARPS